MVQIINLMVIVSHRFNEIKDEYYNTLPSLFEFMRIAFIRHIIKL